MTIWGIALTVAAMSAALSAIPPLMMRGRRLSSIEKRGGILLRYANGARTLSVVLTLLIPVLFTWLLSSKGAPAAVSISVASIFGVAGLAMILESFGVRILVQTTGIVRRSPWAGLCTIEWKKVARIRWVESMRWFEIRATDGARIRVPEFLEGLGWFAATALDETRVSDVADAQTIELLVSIRAAFQREVREHPDGMRRDSS